MKKNKDPIRTKPEVRVFLKLVPFGNITYQISSPAAGVAREEIEAPVYKEPSTTAVERIEVQYEQGGTYSVPKTTASG